MSFIRCLLRKFPVIDYQTLDRMRTTFILSVTWFQFPPINRGRIASFTPMVFPTWPLFQQRLLNRTVDVCGSSMPLTARPWLDTGFFHPFLKMIPVFIDYCWISTVEIAFMLPPRGYPRSFNRYYINRHHTMYSYACKKFDPAGVIRILVCEHSCWVIWVEYLCFSFPMYLLLWANHQHVINIHLHVEKLSVRDIPYSFFFPRPYTTIIVQCFTTFWPGNVV